MKGLSVIVNPRHSNWAPANHSVTSLHRCCFQVRVRRNDSSSVINGDRVVAHDRAGESHHTAINRAHSRPDLRCDIDTPVTRPSSDRSVRTDHVRAGGNSEAEASKRYRMDRDERHGKQLGHEDSDRHRSPTVTGNSGDF